MTIRICQRWWLPTVVLVAAATSVVGQVTLDGTVGPSGVLPGPNYSIPDTVGTTVGNNLFHSFGQFHLSQGELASFTGPDGIANVIARVTGGQASSIDGTLECTIPNANFYFINPFGVIFGSHAQVNVSGAFVATTADYVKLSGGGRFDARTPANDVLTTAPVSAFGFLGPTVSEIKVNGPPVDEGAPVLVTVGEGKTIGFIGGNISIDNVSLTPVDGRLALVSVASAGELVFDTDNLAGTIDTTPFAMLGNITLTGGSYVDVSGNQGGRIMMEGNNIAITGDSADFSVNIFSVGFDTGAGLGVDLTARHAINIRVANLLSYADGSGRGGDIRLTASLVRIGSEDGGVAVGAGTFGDGRAGDVSITADTFELLYNAGLSSTTAGPGDAGDIRITANTVRMNGYGKSVAISAESFSGCGKPGNVNIHVTDTLTLNSLAQILSTNYDPHQDADGNPYIQTIEIHAKSLTITDDSLISTITWGGGPGGDIAITANSVVLDDANTQTTASGITSATWESGNGGNVTITADTIDLRNRAVVTASSVSIATGDAGSVNLDATAVRLSDGASVASAASGTGKGGSVTVHADDSVWIQGQSQLSAAAEHNDGGDVLLSAGHSIQLDQGFISAKADGNGGNITLTAPAVVYLLNSRITAESVNGDGGNITIDPQFVILNHSALVASAIGGNGGNVTIVADYYLNSESSIDVSSEFGLVGTVAIMAPDLDLSGNVEVLPADLLDAERLLQPHCGMHLPGGASSFVVRGRGGRPVEPSLLLPVIPSVGEDDAQ